MKNQVIIDRMYAGDREAIISGIDAESPILVMNSIMAGVKMRIRDIRFMNGLKKAEERKEILLGISLSKAAVAAEHLLGIRKYEGDDQMILSMIASEFRI